MGLSTILFVVFLVLKLTDHIDWSWWWVTSPLWIEFLIGIFVFGILGVAASNGSRTARNSLNRTSRRNY